MPSKEDATAFHSVVAKLLLIKVRHNILSVVSFLTTKILRSTDQDARKLKKVTVYVNNMRDKELVLDVGKKLEVLLVPDTAIQYHDEGLKSQSDIVMKLGGVTIYSGSKKQQSPAKSSCEG